MPSARPLVSGRLLTVFPAEVEYANIVGAKLREHKSRQLRRSIAVLASHRLLEAASFTNFLLFFHHLPKLIIEEQYIGAGLPLSALPNLNTSISLAFKDTQKIDAAQAA